MKVELVTVKTGKDLPSTVSYLKLPPSLIDKFNNKMTKYVGFSSRGLRDIAKARKILRNKLTKPHKRLISTARFLKITNRVRQQYLTKKDLQ